MKFYRDVLAGPVLFALLFTGLQESFGFKGAGAIATTAWVALWWVLRPVSVSVTALLPIVLNAVFGLIPNERVYSTYFCETIIILVGSDLICMTWTSTKLDQRVSVKALSYIGTSLRQQIMVWLFCAVGLSVFLPNVVVATIYCPIAIAMLKATGLEGDDFKKVSAPILLAIGWGSGIGGFGSPIGSPSNMVSITYLEQILGHEFLYVDWCLRFTPLLFLVTLGNMLFLWHMKLPVSELAGSKEYFSDLYRSFGKMKRGEWLAATAFFLATLLSFARPLWSEYFPALKPAYIYLFFGALMFFLRDEKGKIMLDWKEAEDNLMWGLLLLIASGLALGRMLIETGAVKTFSQMMLSLDMPTGLPLMFICCTFSWLFSEISSNTAAASISLPIVLSICQAIQVQPIPYVLASIVAVNCAYILPLTTRAVVVSFGLDPTTLSHEGVKLALLNLIVMTSVCYGLSLVLPGLYNSL